MTGCPTTAVVDAAVRRLASNLTEIDRLLGLLRQVQDGYRFTNRLDEAVLLVPEAVMAEIRQVIGVAPTDQEM